jgi:hypothetical protein
MPVALKRNKRKVFEYSKEYVVTGVYSIKWLVKNGGY